MKTSIKPLREFKSRYRVLRKFNRLMKQIKTPLEHRSDGYGKKAFATSVYTRESAVLHCLDIRDLFKNLLKLKR